MRRHLRKMERSNEGRVRRIEYYGVEGTPPTIPSPLTTEQQSTLRAIAESGAIWNCRTNLGTLFGRPETAAGLRQFAADHT